MKHLRFCSILNYSDEYEIFEKGFELFIITIYGCTYIDLRWKGWGITSCIGVTLSPCLLETQLNGFTWNTYLFWKELFMGNLFILKEGINANLFWKMDFNLNMFSLKRDLRYTVKLFQTFVFYACKAASTTFKYLYVLNLFRFDVWVFPHCYLKLSGSSGKFLAYSNGKCCCCTNHTP